MTRPLPAGRRQGYGQQAGPALRLPASRGSRTVNAETLLTVGIAAGLIALVVLGLVVGWST